MHIIYTLIYLFLGILLFCCNNRNNHLFFEVSLYIHYVAICQYLFVELFGILWHLCNQPVGVCMLPQLHLTTV